MGGRIGVLVEVNCETDFVAKTAEFQEFVKDIAMHIAASNPEYVSREDVPEDVIAREKEIFKAAALNEVNPNILSTKLLTVELRNFYLRFAY